MDEGFGLSIEHMLERLLSVIREQNEKNQGLTADLATASLLGTLSAELAGLIADNNERLKQDLIAAGCLKAHL